MIKTLNNYFFGVDQIHVIDFILYYGVLSGSSVIALGCWIMGN